MGAGYLSCWLFCFSLIKPCAIDLPGQTLRTTWAWATGKGQQHAQDLSKILDFGIFTQQDKDANLEGTGMDSKIIT